MKVSELIKALQELLDKNGDGYVLIDIEYTTIKVSSVEDGAEPGSVVIF